ncbi:hypothetical protein ACFQ3Z_02040 [Streptomyces nogalater]
MSDSSLTDPSRGPDFLDRLLARHTATATDTVRVRPRLPGPFERVEAVRPRTPEPDPAGTMWPTTTPRPRPSGTAPGPPPRSTTTRSANGPSCAPNRPSRKRSRARRPRSPRRRRACCALPRP